MAEFVEIATIARRLYLPDVVPWSKLFVEHNLELLRERYALDQLNPIMPQIGMPMGADVPVPVTGQLFALRGSFRVEETVVAFEQLSIQPTIVQVQIGGDAEFADKFLDHLSGFFREISPERDYSRKSELSRSYQTVAIARLSFAAEAMFSRQFSKYLEAIKPRLSPSDTKIDLRLNTLRWVVTYRPETTDFIYQPKFLTIEPRQGSRPNDRLYYTQSPVDFKTHKELLESLEKALS